MIVKNDTDKLNETTDPFRIVQAFGLLASEANISGPEYRVFSSNDKAPIISNVPAPIYENEKPRKYKNQILSGTKKRLIEFLQLNIDTFQYSEVSDPKALGKGEIFQLNSCYNNSKRLFQLLSFFGDTGVIPNKYKPKIALGYIANRIPCGTVIGDIIVKNEGLIIHDWHTWNYIDNILIDLSLFRGGNVLSLGSKAPSWGEAKDHVFGISPKGILYFGKTYVDLKIFDAKIASYFPQ